MILRICLVIMCCSFIPEAAGQDCELRFESSPPYLRSWGHVVLEGVAQPGLYSTLVTDESGPGAPITAYIFFARWDGGEWRSAGAFPGVQFNGEPSVIDDLCIFDDGAGPAIYGCGLFNANELGEPIRSVAKWSGEKWVDVGGGINGRGYAMCVFDDGVLGPALYVGGWFDEAGGRPMWNIARWDGDVWSDVGGGVTPSGVLPGIRAMEVYDDGSGPALFVGGGITHVAPAQTSEGIGKWTGSEWVPIGAHVQGPWLGPTHIDDMVVHDDGSGPALYTVGAMGAIAGLRVQGIARWDGEMWTNVGDTGGSLWRRVSSLAVFDDGTGPRLYAGGSLSDWFGHPASLARWDGVEWEDMTTIGGVQLGPGTMATLQTPQGQELWLGSPLGRLRCVEDCAADCDGSGGLEFLDFLCFQEAFVAGAPSADCDGSGAHDFFDFLCFQNHFAAGCD